MQLETSEVIVLQEKLRNALNPKRYTHTLGVAYLSASLAMCYGVSHRKALLAGLLHDCAKDYSDTELLEGCLQHNIYITEYEKKLPQLLHAAYGVYIAEKEYGVTDPEVLLAIRNHTVGRPGMSILEQIVFLADYLETERTQPTTPSLDIIRKTAFQSLDEATYLVEKNTLSYFERTGSEIDPMTYEVFQFYEGKVKKEVL